MKRFLKVCIVPAASLLPAIGFATDLNWSGFISVSAGQTMDKGDTVVVDPVTRSSYDDIFRYNKETIAGLQAQAIISKKLRATIQTIAKASQSYDPNVEWAYISYSIRPNLDINVGRFRLPLFLYSDFLDVGYAYEWVRPPIEVYRAPVSTTEGFNLNYSNLYNNFEYGAQIWFTGSTVTPNATTTIDFTNSNGFSFFIAQDWWKARYVHAEAKRDTYVSGVGKVGDVSISFDGLALTFDVENYIWRSEYIEADLEEGYSNAWYGTIGYNIGNITPLFTSSKSKNYDGLDKEAQTLGLAWRFHDNIAFKFEYSFRKSNLTGSSVKEDADLLSTSFDMVF